MNMKIKKTGFTIIELLIVSAIIGLLSAVVLQSLNTARQKSRNTTRLAQIDQINKALEISAVTTIKLPWSNGWVCLGHTTNNTGTDCSAVANAQSPTINNTVRTNLAGGVIPKDPSHASGLVGSWYLYHSNLVPVAQNECTAATCPQGAYLYWVTENSTICGRGKHWSSNVNGVTGNSGCLLRIGDMVNS